MRFTEVLYVHKICLQHIYISGFDKMGLEPALSGGGRITRGPDGQGVGKVPWNANRLGMIEHVP